MLGGAVGYRRTWRQLKHYFKFFKDNREHFLKQDEIEGKEQSFRMAAREVLWKRVCLALANEDDLKLTSLH